MRSGRHLLVFALGLATIFAAAVGWRARTTARLHLELAGLRHEHAELARLRSERERLAANRTNAADLAALREAAAASRRLQAEAAELRKRAAAVKSPAEEQRVSSPSRQGNIPDTPWTNAGRSTPASAVESLLWASAHGEVEVLADLLAFTPESQAKIDAVFATLPPEKRAPYATPAAVFATLVAARMPHNLAQTEILETTPGPEETAMRLLLRRTNGTTREATFHVRQQSQGWRLLVPAQVVDDYLRMLTGADKTDG